MTIIGLTGPTGAGKSTVAALLREHGLFVADGDAAARAVMQPGAPLLSLLAQTFGNEILQPDGTLNRAELAKHAFATPDGVRKLNELTHPIIDRYLFTQIEAHSDCPAAVIDAAALIESGIYQKCDLLAVVLAPVETRLARILARDGLTHEQAMLRIGAQQPDAFYTDKADVVLHNDGTHDLQAETQKILERIPA